MNEPEQRLPKYQPRKRSGHALVVLDGREIYLGKHGTPKSLERYNREIAQWLQQGGWQYRKRTMRLALPMPAPALAHS